MSDHNSFKVYGDAVGRSDVFLTAVSDEILVLHLLYHWQMCSW